MKIFLATDHAGYELKEALNLYLTEHGHEVVDLGAHEHDPEDDYPDLIAPLAQALAAEPQGTDAVRGCVARRRCRC
jgi:ribose 5-phosphate isomerase B